MRRKQNLLPQTCYHAECQEKGGYNIQITCISVGERTRTACEQHISEAISYYDNNACCNVESHRPRTSAHRVP